MRRQACTKQSILTDKETNKHKHINKYNGVTAFTAEDDST